VGALVLACGDATGHRGFTALTERDDVEVREVSAKPGREEVDPLLAGLAGRRLVVMGTDADLAAVVRRLMRKELLGDVEVGFVPTRDSAVALLWGLPDDPIEVALRGEIDPVPLVRDDAGGVLVGLGRIDGVRGVAYCDDITVVRGKVHAVEVTPDPDRGLGMIVRVIRRGLISKRSTQFRGRAFQLGSLPVLPVKDGDTHPRPTSKWTWYRHTEDLRAARGVV
jgi:hypothetical protein